MTKCGTVKLTRSSAQTDNFDLLSDVDGYSVPFESGITRTQLTTGDGFYTTNIPTGATIVRIQSNDICTNFIDVTITPIPPIITSYGATIPLDPITSNEYNVARVVNHTPHSSPDVITMDFSYSIGMYALQTSAEVNIYYRINSGGWQFVDGGGATPPTATTTTWTGTFDITNVAYDDLIEVRMHLETASVFDSALVNINTTGGSVTYGDATVTVGSPSNWNWSL